MGLEVVHRQHRAVELTPRHIQFAGAARANGNDHSVVVAAQLFEAQRAAYFYTGSKSHPFG